MKVHFSFVGIESRPEDIHIDLLQIPREGEIISIKGVSDAETYVRTVVWYLLHNDEGEQLYEPFVYVVVGPNRAESPPSRLEQYLKRDDKPETPS
jgi:hypothetical protein